MTTAIEKVAQDCVRVTLNALGRWGYDAQSQPVEDRARVFREATRAVTRLIASEVQRQTAVGGLAKTEWVSHTRWTNYARRCEQHNMRACGTSLTFTSIAARAQHLIVEVRDDALLVKKGWRAAMRQSVPTQERSV